MQPEFKQQQNVSIQNSTSTFSLKIVGMLGSLGTQFTIAACGNHLPDSMPEVICPKIVLVVCSDLLL